MRTTLKIVVSVFCLFAAMPQSQARVLIYTFTPAVPSFELAGINPDNHQELNASPRVVTAVFSLAIDPTRSELKLFDPYNNPISGVMSAPKDTMLTFTLPPHLLSGTYRVEWSATCACAGNPPVSSSTLPVTIVNGIAVGPAAVDNLNTGTTAQGNPTVKGTSYFTID